MKLVAGLGNPGRDYAGTYHNVGFDALDTLAARFSAPDFKGDGAGKKFNALTCDISVSGEKVLLVKPLTYMNLSGDAIGGLSRYFKIEPKDILVFFDDIDLHKGVVRARENGSAGTHNGMRDIVYKLGSTDFARIRIGIGNKPNYMNLADYVLSHYGEAEKKIFELAFKAACDLAEAWIAGKTWQDKTVSVV
ncbi:MAG: aminoacyl-tRNA hydrolase [Clostridiales bacterium]|nr:aminoacyl-tRNA hydrolase [Clostridiales bacterium]